ncbi:MAG TPA: SpoIID/LytB domain-containing protein, partial [candidate division Zixibacteria bacterium]|nr:SpoIID/LytB domain-containing protein [candidate division Zixibacteria bacterium]
MNTRSIPTQPSAGRRMPLAPLAVLLTLTLTLALSACAPSKLRPTQSAEPSHVRLPFVRALLSDTEPEATVGGQGAIAIECLRGSERFVYYSPKNVRLRFTSGAIGLVNSKNEIIESNLDQVTISARNSQRLLWVNGAPYRGMVRLTPGQRGLTLVNVLYIEDYLRGVVPPELGPLVSADDMESIKAQAIAARTYTMSHLGQYGALPYDLKSDVSDQVYSGASAEKDFISRAVIATTGEVARYQDQFIHAYYHSTCG